MTRRIVTWGMVAAGFGLQVITYLFLAAPLGRSSGVEFSNPRMQYAPAVFVLGVVLVFLAAVVYELMPDRSRSRASTRDEDAPQAPASAEHAGG